MPSITLEDLNKEQVTETYLYRDLQLDIVNDNVLLDNYRYRY